MDRTPVHGGRIERFDDFLGEALRKQGKRLDEEVVRELVLCYGSEYPAVLQHMDKDPGADRRVAGDRPTIRAMIRHAVLHEMALRLGDVIFRRTGLGTIGDPGEECLRTCAGMMGELGWARPDRRGNGRTRLPFALAGGARDARIVEPLSR
jgi:glycerol-3-phosphate dehydrogenase